MLGFLSGTVFSYMLIVGFVFSIVTFIASMFGASGDAGGDIGDVGDIGDLADLGDVSGDGGFDGDASDSGSTSGAAGILAILLPLSPVVWCIFLLIAGMVGEVMLQASQSYAVCLLVGIPVGYGCMLLFHRFIMLPMKRARNYVDSADDLIGAEGTMFEPIAEGEGRRGAVQVKGSSGSVIYTAKTEDGSALPRGTVVRVVAFTEDKTAVVICDPATEFFDSVEGVEGGEDS